MVHMFKQEMLISGPVSVSPGSDFGGRAIEVVAGVSKVYERTRAIRHLRLQLTNLVVAVLEANDFGGTLILELPDTNVLLLGAEADLTIVKAGTLNGIVAATDITVGIGQAAASNATLSGTMQDVLNVTSLTTDALSVTWQKHSNDNGTAAILFMDDSATLQLFMNVTAAITADDSVSVSGTLDLFFVDVGNVTS